MSDPYAEFSKPPLPGSTAIVSDVKIRPVVTTPKTNMGSTRVIRMVQEPHFHELQFQEHHFQELHITGFDLLGLLVSRRGAGCSRISRHGEMADGTLHPVAFAVRLRRIDGIVVSHSCLKAFDAHAKD